MPAMYASKSRRYGSVCLALLFAFTLAACEGEQPARDVGQTIPQPEAADAASPAGTTKAASPAGSVIDATPSEDRFGDRQLDHPDDLQILMLAYRLEGRTPPIDEWASAQYRVKYADEFKRPSLLKEEQERLQGVYDGTAEVGRLRLNVNAQFGEYDAGRGGYYLDAFMPGSAFSFDAQPSPEIQRQRISLQVDNPEELNFWPLDAARAQDVLTRNSGLRSVVLDSRFLITGASRRSEGLVIKARLLGYTIGSDHYNRPATFGEVNFDGQGER